MALARVKTWNAGDTLTAADLNAEFNNILNNPTSLINLTAAGDLAIVSSAAAVTRLAIGTSGQTLTVSTALLPSWAAASATGSLSLVRGLTGTVTSSQTVTLSADQYVLQTTAASPSFFSLNSTASFTVNVGTSGPAANGRDVGPVFSSTFVHCYAITTGSGSTVAAGISSTTPPPTGPVLPTSYSAWTYLGTYPYSSASTTFTNGQRQRGATVYNEIYQNALNAGAATSEATVSLVSLMPAVALQGLFRVSDVSAGATTVTIRVISGSTFFTIPHSVNADTDVCMLKIPNVSQQFFYVESAAGQALTVDVMGYQVPNGGES